MALSKCGIDQLDETAQEKKAHGSYTFPVAIYGDVLEIDEVGWHWHVEIELIRVAEGEGYFSCNGETQLLKEGQGVFINSGTLHSCRITSKGHCVLHSIVFHPRFVSGGTDTILWERYLYPLTENKKMHCCYMKGDTEWETETLDLIEDAWQKVMYEPAGYEFRARNDLSEIVFRLYHNMDVTLNKEETGTDITRIMRLKTMIDHIQKNYTEDINITDIASSASVSTSECQRCFRNVLHISPGRYLMNVRLQKAEEFLQNTALPAAEIAMLCGFQDSSYFGRLFKKETGMTPVTYRQHRKQQ